MWFTLAALIPAFIIAFGRQTAVFAKMRISLWFFTHFEKKRIVFAIISLSLLVAGFLTEENRTTFWIVAGIVLLLLITSFLFDFKYIFPEIKKVEKKAGSSLDLPSDTEIIGVKIKDYSIAYPLNVVIPRHIINDDIAGKHVVISYCAICRSALAFEAELDGEPLYFKVAGVWRRNMIMVDNRTNSLWQQATGECIYGKSKGQQLALLSGENTKWGAWLTANPNSDFAYNCVEARKGFMSREKMLKGLNFATTKMTPPGFTDLSGLPKRETVFGITLNGISRAYPITELEGVEMFYDQYGDQKLELRYDAESLFLKAFEFDSKTPVLVEKHWWLGWKEFHPETEIWRK